MTIIYKPKSGSVRKEGTIMVASPKAAISGLLTPYYTVDTYVSALPTTGQINSNYSNRFNAENIQNALFNITSNGVTSQTIVPAISERSIRVESYAFTINENTEVSWLSDSVYLVSGMALSGTAGISNSADYSFQTEIGDALKLLASTSGTNVVGHLTYRIV